MAQNTLLGNRLSACDAATVEELDQLVQGIYFNHSPDANRLFQYISKWPQKKVHFENLRHLRIIGDYYKDRLANFEIAGISRGFYLNKDATWLLLILPEKPDLGQYLSGCSSLAESLMIWNSSMYSRDVGKLPGLKRLHLQDNPLLEDFERLADLKHLEELRIYNSPKLTGLSGLDKLTQLTRLNLYSCSSLTELNGLEKLTQLTELDLSGCSRLTRLNGLEKLTQLTELDLSGCSRLTRLNGLEKLTQLTDLDLSGCSRLTELNGLDKLTQLTQLDLSDCSSLTELNGLDKLTQLTWLDFSYCISLTELNGLDNLTQLTWLDLSGCSRLTKLNGLEKLTKLIYLCLNSCSNITELSGLDKLTRLTELRLSRCNSLTELNGLDKLTKLPRLDLSYCISLTRLNGLENLTQLVELKLSYCSRLTELPDGIRHLRSLRLLDLREMHLKELPDWLPDIAEAFTLNLLPVSGKQKAIVSLRGTTVEGVDMSIFAQPYEMVVKWFEERKLGRAQPLNEIKVVFLGDGEAGKSHTIARLMNDGGDPDPLVFDGQSTPGIVIRNKEYDLGDRKIQVHYWDFGGQEIMHSMHRIFLTGRTMYVILLNARDDTQSDRAKYWLHNVKSFAPNAPVLLVLNKIDQNENASVDETDLRSRYDKLTKIVRLSALKYSQEQFNEKFTEVLLDEIKNTGFLEVQWPVSWTKVKEHLENLDIEKEPYIMGDAYQDICRQCQVDNNQKDLLHWFNDLGVSFCFCDDGDYALEEYVILRPDWITNALYIILFNKLEGTKNGLIPHESIYRILRSAHNNPDIRCTLPQAKYSLGDIQYVLGVMRKFSLSFPYGDKHEFIPMLCQQNSTVDIQYYRKDADILEFNMEFDYLPNNLLHRLMVERHSELDISNVWRTGAKFQLPELGLSAVVVIDGHILRFFIRHGDTMHRPNTYLAMLKANVDRIVTKMGLKAPASQLVYKIHGKRAEFSYDRLLKLHARGRKEEYCDALDEDFPIEDILNQSAPDGTAEELQLLEDIVVSCKHIQAGYEYASTGDGTGMEDIRNRRIQNDLHDKKYHIFDQPQRGFGGTGQSSGELDLYLEHPDGKPWTIIEALRVCNGEKKEWKKHLDKLVGNYNFFGQSCAYLLTYVDTDEAEFERIWDKYPECIETYSPGQYTVEDGSYINLSDSNEQYIRKAKACYTCGKFRITVYHLFIMVKPQPPKPTPKPRKKKE